MDFVKLLIIGILALLKLLITGIMLAIGFRIGALIMTKIEKNIAESKNKVENAV